MVETTVRTNFDCRFLTKCTVNSSSGRDCATVNLLEIGRDEKESRQDLLWYPRRARDATVGEQRRGKRDVCYFDVSGYFGWLRIGSHTGFVCVVGVSVYAPGL